MFELVVRPLLTCALWLCLTLSASAVEMARGQVISVAGGDVITLLDEQHREHRMGLAYIDAPALGQPFGDEAQSALSAMVLGRQVVVQIRGKGADGVTRVELVEPKGHLVNLELVKRGLAWHDAFDVQAKPERDQYQVAQLQAQKERKGMWALDRLEPPRDYRARVGQFMRGWLYVVAFLAAFTLLGLIFTVYEKRITAWLDKQDELTRMSAEANRLARIQAEAEQAEKDQTREIATREFDRLALARRAAEHRGGS